MKTLIVLLICGFFSFTVFAQKRIRDKGMTHQQERMVFEQWDKNKFTPSTKVLGVEVNPLWFVVWGMHPNYRKKDHRPLSPTGPQAIRMGLTTTMKGTSQNYKLHSDTLRNTALSQYAMQTPIQYNPLWQLYYQKEFKELLEDPLEKQLEGLGNEEIQFLIESKAWDKHVKKLAEIKERLEGGRTAVMERGNRNLFYHRLMLEYRANQDWWHRMRSYAPKRVMALKKIQKLKTNEEEFNWSSESDKELARKIVRDLEYIN